MKKLFFLIVVVTLPIIAYFNYKNYKRFNPPIGYELIISDSIDVNYHDPVLVHEYFNKAIEAGSFARMQWTNNEIDVRFPSATPASINAAKYYNQLVSRVGYLERLLLNSAELKAKGHTNDEIKLIESGISHDKMYWIENEEDILAISQGDMNEYVWNVQKFLISKGYEHKLDGLFGEDTKNAIVLFQNQHKLFPAGYITKETLSKFIQE